MRIEGNFFKRKRRPRGSVVENSHNGIPWPIVHALLSLKKHWPPETSRWKGFNLSKKKFGDNGYTRLLLKLKGPLDVYKKSFFEESQNTALAKTTHLWSNRRAAKKTETLSAQSSDVRFNSRVLAPAYTSQNGKNVVKTFRCLGFLSLSPNISTATSDIKHRVFCWLTPFSCEARHWQRAFMFCKIFRWLHELHQN